MDIIKQFLLSGAVKFEESDPVISAELYKLNVLISFLSIQPDTLDL